MSEKAVNLDKVKGIHDIAKLQILNWLSARNNGSLLLVSSSNMFIEPPTTCLSWWKRDYSNYDARWSTSTSALFQATGTKQANSDLDNFTHTYHVSIRCPAYVSCAHDDLCRLNCVMSGNRSCRWLYVRPKTWHQKRMIFVLLCFSLWYVNSTHFQKWAQLFEFPVAFQESVWRNVCNDVYEHSVQFLADLNGAKNLTKF